MLYSHHRRAFSTAKYHPKLVSYTPERGVSYVCFLTTQRTGLNSFGIFTHLQTLIACNKCTIRVCFEIMILTMFPLWTATDDKCFIHHKTARINPVILSILLQQYWLMFLLTHGNCCQFIHWEVNIVNDFTGIGRFMYTISKTMNMTYIFSILHNKRQMSSDP